MFSVLGKHAISKDKKYTHGIDVLGSRQGSWLLKRAGIKKRYGVRGYAGGDEWCRLALTSRKIEMLQKPGLLSLNCLVQMPKSNHARNFFCDGETKAESQMGRKKGKIKTHNSRPWRRFLRKVLGR